jgi:hypothetical protein
MNRCSELAYGNCKLYAADDKLTGEKGCFSRLSRTAV